MYCEARFRIFLLISSIVYRTRDDHGQSMEILMPTSILCGRSRVAHILEDARQPLHFQIVITRHVLVITCPGTVKQAQG